ncbi:siroheme decarboxylase subunit beta [Balneatrix alpica]|uniref:Lrp/AsnC family transcriptional regulator n=1 Tax=Balneatrix alpica TaxID=75684 RepID=A0ABV5Z961_9GAMM|nr:Lrp/AsnC family transcriptional regulator [Balneatrix alpica]
MSELTPRQHDLLHLLQQGLPLTPSPYAAWLQRWRATSTELEQELACLQQQGWIRRSGLIIKHRPLGYRANAMVVWDIADQQVEEVATRLAQCAEISLCYQRPRQLPEWPYNLFTMLHGQSRSQVLNRLAYLLNLLKLDYPHAVLFSTRCFKQQGGRYLDERSPAYPQQGV